MIETGYQCSNELIILCCAVLLLQELSKLTQSLRDAFPDQPEFAITQSSASDDSAGSTPDTLM